MRYILIVFMIFNFSTSAWGQENSNFKDDPWTFYQACKSETETIRLYCDYYLKGVYEAFIAIQLFNSDTRIKALNMKIEDLFCLPNFNETSRVREMFLEWTEKHPEDYQDVGKTLSILLMFEENFPCDPLQTTE